MLFEKATFQVDIEKLRAELTQVRSTYAPFQSSPTYGGWSVTSSTGSYLDGWLKSKTRFVKVSDEMSPEEYAAYVRESGQLRPLIEYSKTTEACLPYTASIIQDLALKGLVPCRARFTILKSGACSNWHRDAPDWLYNVRIHIPIETNEGCLFETETESVHLPADGSAYFIPINNLHRVTNHGDSDRVHLIANVYDTKQVTKFHRYETPGSTKS